ncbi:Uncharacterized protein TCM_037395 [Theobroma cacao]|uniref:Uncharacterized protein n=1 Tax=Theobroma cacao TaxID=3641 RepID=A0A061GLN8_THECC|nr:Uncharacterized protein TCM_037395 [Theobroma cacao]
MGLDYHYLIYMYLCLKKIKRRAGHLHLVETPFFYKSDFGSSHGISDAEADFTFTLQCKMSVPVLDLPNYHRITHAKGQELSLMSHLEFFMAPDSRQKPSRADMNDAG